MLYKVIVELVIIKTTLSTNLNMFPSQIKVEVATPAKLQSCGHQSSRPKVILGAVHQKDQISHYIGSTESP
jgi:hypothetical protein